jgi:hypothetical protein
MSDRIRLLPMLMHMGACPGALVFVQETKHKLLTDLLRAVHPYEPQLDWLEWLQCEADDYLFEDYKSKGEGDDYLPFCIPYQKFSVRDWRPLEKALLQASVLPKISVKEKYYVDFEISRKTKGPALPPGPMADLVEQLVGPTGRVFYSQIKGKPRATPRDSAGEMCRVLVQAHPKQLSSLYALYSAYKLPPQAQLIGLISQMNNCVDEDLHVLPLQVDTACVVHEKQRIYVRQCPQDQMPDVGIANPKWAPDVPRNAGAFTEQLINGMTAVWKANL